MHTNKKNSKRIFRNLISVSLLTLIMADAVCAETDETTFNRGLTLFRNADFKSAQKAFESSILADPDNAAAHFYLGLTHNKLNTDTDAALALEKAHELNPSLPDVELNLGISYYKIKNYKRALIAFEQALSENSESGEANFFIGLILQKKAIQSINFLF
ncbi:MAG: tetratricopeptide repeat protein [Candidatus Electrothrix sp. AR4]|nr:tetratricopeptide repeat protein [Candidatus Electrothrix sp. AR4]